LTVVNYIEM